MASCAPVFPWRAEELSLDVTEEDLSWKLNADPDYFDSGTFVCQCDDGSLLYFQIVVSSVGLYAHTPGFSFKYMPADGSKAVEFAQKHNAGDIKLSDNNCSIDVKGNICHYDHATRTYSVTIPYGGTNNFGDIELTFVPDCESCKLSNGRALYGEKKESFMAVFFVAPRAKVSGCVKKKDGSSVAISGTGFVSRLLQNTKAHRLASTWNLLKLHGEDTSVCVNLLRAPADHGGVRVGQAIVVRGGKILGVSSNVTIEEIDRTYDSTTGYSPPKRSILRADGVTTEKSEPFSVEVDLAHDPMVDRYDILQQVPWVLRMVIKAFISAPWCYRWHVRGASMKLTVAGEEYTIKGDALREDVYVNPA